MHDMTYTFGDATTTWICVHVERDIHTDGAKWAGFSWTQDSSIAQLNDSLLARGVPCILQSSLCVLKVYCKDQRAQTMLLLSMPSGLWCGEPRLGAHIGTGVCEQLFAVARANGLKYALRKPRKSEI